MRFATGDDHFSSLAVLRKGRSSLFENLGRHDAALISNWNKTVGKDDVVYVLGDVGSAPLRRMKEIIGSLNGKKILVLGNHDHLKAEDYLSMGFSEVYDHPIFLSDNVVLSHAPYPFLPGYIVNVHAHLHELRLKDPNYINVSVDSCGFRPVQLDPLIKRAASLKKVCGKFGSEWWAKSYDERSEEIAKAKTKQSDENEML